MNNFDNEFENSIRFLTHYMPNAQDLEKPTLFHSIRVGNYLYSNNYSREICIAGLLHDAIEDTKVTREQIENEFGNDIAEIVQANTKNESIENKYEDQIVRCIKMGESALIVKTADIIDNYNYYTRIANPGGLDYVHRISKLLFKLKPEAYQDPVFEKLNSLLKE